MILQIVRYIVALCLRSRSNCAFCRNPKYQEKHLWPKYRLLGHSAVAAGISHINGLDQTLAYPIHSHLILIVFLIFHFECTCLDAVIYTLLAYMSLPDTCLGFQAGNLYPFNSGGLELTIYIVTVYATLYLICRFAAKPVHELVPSSTRSAIAFSWFLSLITCSITSLQCGPASLYRQLPYHPVYATDCLRLLFNLRRHL